MIARLSLVSALCLLLTGCGDSKNPLSDPQASKPDERLVGAWRWDDSNFHVGHAGKKFPNSMMRVAIAKNKKGKPELSEQLLIFPSVVKHKTYLNVIDEKGYQDKFSQDKGWNAEAVDCYWILKYQVDGDKLLVWPIDLTAKQQAIRDGRIKGVIEKDKPDIFTDTTENVARFVAGEADRLFSLGPFQLKRVGSGVREVGEPTSQAREGRR
jgi:hypothetical protein